MKNKELIKLIKEKASHIEIKNMSSEILSKVDKHAPYETIEPSKPRVFDFSLRKLLMPSLSAVLAVFVFFFVFGLFNTSVNVVAYNETIALSTLSSVTMIESKTETIDQTFTGVLLANDMMDPAKVESEIPKLETFFTWAEQLLVSDGSLLIHQEKSLLIGYQYQLTFQTNDLLDEVMDYEIYFNESVNKYKRTFILDGIIIAHEISYGFNAVANDRKGSITVTIKDDEGYEIEVTSFIKDYEQTYNYQQKYQGEIQEEVEFKWIREGSGKRIEMAFSGRSTNGNYQIRLEQHMMKIQYKIDNKTSEEGELDVEVIESEEGNFYGITVRVNGRKEFTYGNVARRRGNPGNGRN